MYSAPDTIVTRPVPTERPSLLERKYSVSPTSATRLSRLSYAVVMLPAITHSDSGRMAISPP